MTRNQTTRTKHCLSPTNILPPCYYSIVCFCCGGDNTVLGSVGCLSVAPYQLHRVPGTFSLRCLLPNKPLGFTAYWMCVMFPWATWRPIIELHQTHNLTTDTGCCCGVKCSRLFIVMWSCVSCSEELKLASHKPQHLDQVQNAHLNNRFCHRGTDLLLGPISWSSDGFSRCFNASIFACAHFSAQRGSRQWAARHEEQVRVSMCDSLWL